MPSGSGDSASHDDRLAGLRPGQIMACAAAIGSIALLILAYAVTLYVTSPSRDNGRFEAFPGGAVIDTRTGMLCIVPRNECAAFGQEVVSHDVIDRFLEQERQRTGE